MPWYRWAWDFFQSKNQYNFLVAANQISKSSTQIRKCIHWATCPDIWPELWPTKPTQFWYFYPDKGVCDAEYREKWVKEWLPLGEEDEGRNFVEIAQKGAFKSNPIYGWKPSFKNGQILTITFNSGVTIYFKSYEQGVQSLQTASVFAMFCDEELPEDFLSELQARCFSPSVMGYFHLVFTATIGQEIWRCTMEEIGTQHEKFTTAFKQQISMYECLQYMDGSPSPWTKERIQEIEANCKDENEVQRRVYGKFVVDTDRKYSSFQRSVNCKPGHHLPKSWFTYTGVDIGSGGTAHPAAIALVGVKPNFQEGRVYKAWRGDGIITDAGNILDKHIEMISGIDQVIMSSYDWQAKDFFTVASRRGLPFQKALKGREAGEGLLNTLFKNKMLTIYDDDPELLKLIVELQSLKNSTPKPKAKDDLIDALRFACMPIPWDFSVLNRPKPKKKDPDEGMSDRERDRRGRNHTKSGVDLLQADFDLANEAYDYGLEGSYLGADFDYEDEL